MNGIVLREANAAVEREAAKRGLPLRLAAVPALAFERSLIVGAGVEVPWTLVAAGFGFLARWEAAAPLAGPLASQLGDEAERARTAVVVGDLRLPVYASELLFLRQSAAAEELLACWQAQGATGGDERLALLRALHLVKPLFLALPPTWLVAPADGTLVTVQIGPRKFVRCRAEEAATYLTRYQGAGRG